MKLLLEALLVTVAGSGLALALNAARADGLELGRDYFPRDASAAGRGVGASKTSPVTAAPSQSKAGAMEAQPGDAAEAAIRQRLAEKGLQAIAHDEVVTLLHSDMGLAGAYLVVDARRADDFSAGHIPGAVHLDPFFPDAGLAQLLPLLGVAQRIIVYCNGGECDDSESAALLLLQFGAQSDRLAVYTGGIKAWSAAGLELESDS